MPELVYGIAKSGKVASEINEGQFNMAPLGVSQYDGLEQVKRCMTCFCIVMSVLVCCIISAMSSCLQVHQMLVRFSWFSLLTQSHV